MNKQKNENFIKKVEQIAKITNITEFRKIEIGKIDIIFEKIKRLVEIYGVKNKYKIKSKVLKK
jgi:hypothetical protein